MHDDKTGWVVADAAGIASVGELLREYGSVARIHRLIRFGSLLVEYGDSARGELDAAARLWMEQYGHSCTIRDLHVIMTAGL